MILIVFLSPLHPDITSAALLTAHPSLQTVEDHIYAVDFSTTERLSKDLYFSVFSGRPLLVYLISLSALNNCGHLECVRLVC